MAEPFEWILDSYPGAAANPHLYLAQAYELWHGHERVSGTRELSSAYGYGSSSAVCTLTTSALTDAVGAGYLGGSTQMF